MFTSVTFPDAARQATVTVGRSDSSTAQGSRMGVEWRQEMESDETGEESEMPAWMRARVVAFIAAASVPIEKAVIV
jgi:hypothetical protein